MQKLLSLGGTVYTYIQHSTVPKSKNKDLARREFILNILLLGSLLLSTIATVSTSIDYLLASPRDRMNYLPTYATTLGIFAIFIATFLLSRRGMARLAAYVFITLYIVIGAYLGVKWGASVPMGLLIYSLMIVMAGILVSSRSAFVLTFIIATILFLLVHLQSAGALIVDENWKAKPPTLRTAAIYSVTLFLIALVSWLFNREMEKALQRARQSEAAVKRQRDRLEITVAKRTQQLKQAQKEKLMQMYRFAEVGKLSLGLFHDLANPLNLVSLNLNELRSQSRQKQSLENMHQSLEQATEGTERLEQLLKAARKQVQNQPIVQRFSLNEEIQQAIQILSYKAKRAKVRIVFEPVKNITALGNPIKFTQVIMNLISNGIDAYDGIEKKGKLVEIVMTKVHTRVIISVQDFGCGIAAKDLPHIFDPLFTTKGFEKGTGIGLSICKDGIKKDFRGTIDVTSVKGEGSTFTVSFPLALSSVRPLKRRAKQRSS